MPKGKGTYGTKKGRPPKKKTVAGRVMTKTKHTKPQAKTGGYVYKKKEKKKVISKGRAKRIYKKLRKKK